MKIKMHCSFGFAVMEDTSTIEIDESELEDMNEDEKEEYILEQYVHPWADEHLDFWYE